MMYISDTHGGLFLPVPTSVITVPELVTVSPVVTLSVDTEDVCVWSGSMDMTSERGEV